MLGAIFLTGVWAVWVVLVFMVLYLILLTMAAAMRVQGLPQARHARLFRIIIPAHNEELVLGSVLQRLCELKYARDHFEVVVVADNCTDRTAELARKYGARVLERSNNVDRGKGHALAYAFATLQSEQFDAYVVLDADTLVDLRLLSVLNTYLEAGHRVVQARYDVLNPWENRRTALMFVALTLFNYVRPLGRRRLGLSTGLKGNGMCFDKSVIDAYPWNAFSLAEDIEYTTTLLLHGERIIFAPEAYVAAQMPVARNQATSQRMRWEAGRLQLARRDGLRLILTGLQRRDAQLFDWGMDLVIPPLAALVLSIVAGLLVVIFGTFVLETIRSMGLVMAWIMLLVAVTLFVFAGMVVAQLPKQAYLGMVTAPGYVLWKLWIYTTMIVRRAPKTWVRTERTQIQKP